MVLEIIQITAGISLVVAIILLLRFSRRDDTESKPDSPPQIKTPYLTIAVKIADFAEMMSLYGTGVLGEVKKTVLSKLGGILDELGVKSDVRYIGGGLVLAEVYSKIADPKYLAYRLSMEIRELKINFSGMSILVRTTLGMGRGEDSHDKAIAAAEIGGRESKPLIDFKDIALDIDRNVKIANIQRKYEELREALRSGNVIPVFQPIVHSGSRTVSKFESLGRVRTPEGELRSLAQYMDVLKGSPLMEECVIALFDSVFSVAQRISHGISFNLDLEDINSKMVVDFILHKLGTDPATARKIVFEILETEGRAEAEIVKEFCQKVKAYGVGIAIDDFGTGYSNFGRILELKPSYIKIDGSIISKINDDRLAFAEAKAIASFCKEVGLESVAEFVSNTLIYRKVLELGIDYCQGYLFSPPITLEEVMERYAEDQPSL